MLYRKDIIYSIENDNDIYSALGVKLHGAMMNLINPQYAEFLHRGELQPFSISCITKDNGMIQAKFCALCDNANVILETMEKQNEIKIYGIDKSLKQISVNNFNPADANQLGINSDFVKISFCSPAVYRNKGKALCTIDLAKYFSSVAQKYKAFVNKDISVDEVVSSIRSMVLMSDCKFQTDSYNVSGTIYKGMSGYGVYKLPIDKAKSDFITRMLSFAEYSGIGAKTSMGMGAIQVTAL